MLMKINKNLIKKENNKHNVILVLFKKNKKDIKKILKNYNLYEFTEHWYDGHPIECNNCKHNKCSQCITWKKWNKSENQLSFNNWIDIISPSFLNLNQKKCDKTIQNIFKKEIFKDVEYKDRLFKAFREDNSGGKYLQLFYYNRDRENKDYWFILKKKEKKTFFDFFKKI